VPPLLTAALIVRDESAFLPGCLESLSGIVDELVVVDTGSVDDTPDIARRYGARLAHHRWADDFSQARNVSLDLARGDWILYIDADERLEDTTRADVENLLRGCDHVAFRLLLRPLAHTTPYREYRMWRNDPRIRFEGLIHEKVVPAIHRVAEEDGRPIGLADFRLEHLGYEGDQTRKHLRNLPLLRRQLQIEPGNLFAWHHLARVLSALGDPEGAERALLSAVDMARTSARHDPVACLSYVDLIRCRQMRGEDVSALLAEARAAFPDNCVVLWLEARCLIEGGAFADAIVRLDQILGVDWALQRDQGPAYDQQLVGELPWDAKGLCHLRLGAYDQAAAAYTAAARCAPGNPSYRVKSQLAKARAREAHGARTRDHIGALAGGRCTP
jgi:tetratricopeptide (TPR) repeat protein